MDSGTKPRQRRDRGGFPDPAMRRGAGGDAWRDLGPTARSLAVEIHASR
jgi:hypothetical protein